MKICEKCLLEHDGKYASGRFCSPKCSRSFSTSIKRKEINKKVSKTITAKTHYIEKICLICETTFKVKKSRSYKKTCSKKCGYKLSNSYVEKREKLSIARTQAILDGKTNSKSIKCVYDFNGKSIRCDSKIEYACLNYFETVFQAVSMERCRESVEYDDDGQTRRFTPDFIIETPSDCFIVECKSFASPKNLNEKWRKYNELSLKKKQILIEFASSTNRKSFWFTKDLHSSYYNKVKIIAR